MLFSRSRGRKFKPTRGHLFKGFGNLYSFFIMTKRKNRILTRKDCQMLINQNSSIQACVPACLRVTPAHIHWFCLHVPCSYINFSPAFQDLRSSAPAFQILLCVPVLRSSAENICQVPNLYVLSKGIKWLYAAAPTLSPYPSHWSTDCATLAVNPVCMRGKRRVLCLVILATPPTTPPECKISVPIFSRSAFLKYQERRSTKPGTRPSLNICSFINFLTIQPF